MLSRDLYNCREENQRAVHGHLASSVFSALDGDEWICFTLGKKRITKVKGVDKLTIWQKLLYSTFATRKRRVFSLIWICWKAVYMRIALAASHIRQIERVSDKMPVDGHPMDVWDGTNENRSRMHGTCYANAIAHHFRTKKISHEIRRFNCYSSLVASCNTEATEQISPQMRLRKKDIFFSLPFEQFIKTVSDRTVNILCGAQFLFLVIHLFATRAHMATYPKWFSLFSARHNAQNPTQNPTRDEEEEEKPNKCDFRSFADIGSARD